MVSELEKDIITNYLRKNVCVVTFTKKNGEERVMNCTLSEEIVPQQSEVNESTRTKKPNPDVMAVWDTEIGAWRSFRWDSLIDFKREIKLS